MSTLVDAEVLGKALPLELLDAEGKKVTFMSLFEDLHECEGWEGNGKKRLVVVFIRHFFCGNCQAYISQVASVPKTAVEEAGVKIVVIGCGGWEPIKHYVESTRAPVHISIYADPSRALFRALGMTTETLQLTPKNEAKKPYIGSSILATSLSTIWDAITHPALIGKQGNFSQLGGEFVFAPGPICTFASRMKHTEDHVEVTDLMKEAGVTYAQ